MKLSLLSRAQVYACLLNTLCWSGYLRAQAPPSQATLKVIYTFKAQGGTPTALVEITPGSFLGITATSPGLFSITSGGTYKFFYMFPAQRQSIGAIGLTPALNGQIYGAAATTGIQTTFSELFSVGSGGKVTGYPYNGATQGGPENLVQDPDGYMYTFFATAENPVPIFSKVDYQGNPTSLYTFSSDQGLPYVLFLGAGGNFYGISLFASETGRGGLFRLTPAGAFSWLVPSMPLGSAPTYPVSLIEATNGNFYGTAPEGGKSAAGSIYLVTPSGTVKTIYEFTDVQTGIPETLLQASDGMLYGTARGEYNSGFHGYSSVFRIDPSSGAFQTIFNFKDLSLGECECRMIQGSDGKLYGASLNVGVYGLGTVWALDAGLPPPPPRIGGMYPSAGSAGQKVLLWGANLLGATAVSFNGTASQFAVASSQGIWVMVPEGAASGPVTVTTPNGRFTIAQSFSVQ